MVYRTYVGYRQQHHRCDDPGRVGGQFGKQFGYAALDVAYDFLSFLSGKCGVELVDIGVEEVVGVLVYVEYCAVDVGWKGFFSFERAGCGVVN